MIYPLLAACFGVSVLLALLLLGTLLFTPPRWKQHRSLVWKVSACWFLPYFAFILLLTGPSDLSVYPPRQTSPFKLPWAPGVTRFVMQGNRSFTSHRGVGLYAWDFVMPVGTEVLAARGGTVAEVLDSEDGVGFVANFISIAHDDDTRSVYAHLRHGGSLVRVGDRVQQGTPIALSGMVGQTPAPHLHFYVTNKAATAPVAVSFNDVAGTGVPLAGHLYTSGNVGPARSR